ncbi:MULTISPECIES: DUF768 domain-containing protein [unclassified Mesorhizobium]|uniref:DUF768 domain-containing protein n=1 Tax=unclassified Mesorhizobium TaxID=325217 RepID=UPI00142EEC8D|nr:MULTISPECIES: DUF768 domain-containing protein [unclassified Mesorhizobium]
MPDEPVGNPIAASDVPDQMLKAAEKLGIAPSEVTEEVGSVFEVIFEAMADRRGG